VVRDVVVAETDAAARDLAINGGIGRAWKEYLKPTYERFGILDELMPDKSIAAADVDAEYLADHVWIVGSPDTVIRKFENWFDELGGPFGTLLIYSHDFIDNPAPWEESMRLLAQEVAPKLP
jgi:alkanesulfonate monooxygenase SsuD/methylene tetrahydromethanopterin reductase-like flavin-dependent oxidoreductase (luciferase family)